MTSYQGGKKRIGKRIYQVIRRIESELLGNEKLEYFEPFCGMCSVLIHFAVDGDRDIFASDVHPDLIMMWKALQNGWKPPTTCSKKRYLELKHSEPSPERAVIGFSCTFNGNFFAGGCRIGLANRNFVKCAYNGLMKMVPDIMDVKFLGPDSYDSYEPENMLIYCDPPYRGNNLSPKEFRAFDHDEFWDTMRQWSKNNIVIISEWEAPSDFVCIWNTQSLVTTGTRTVRYQDCLYMHSSLAKFLKPKVRDELKAY